MLCQHGIDVTYAIATKGGRGKNGEAKKRLEDLRSKYQLDAAEVLGVKNATMFNYPDKGLSEHIQPFARDLITLIERIQPDIIFSWDPDYIYNPHPDHCAAAQAGAIAGEHRNLIFYGTRRPEFRVGYGEDIFQRKIQSLKAHRTETPWYYLPIVKLILKKRHIPQGKIAGFKYAEVFRKRL